MVGATQGWAPWAVLAAVLAAPAGCGARSAANTTAPPTPARAERPGPSIADLTRFVPRGADHCTAVRPAALEPERRNQFALVSRAVAGLWSPALQLQMAVVVERSRRGGRRGRVIALRSALDGAALRSALDAGLGLELYWGEGEPTCGPDDCAARARQVAPNTVVISGGRWLAPSDAMGVEVQCAALVAARPDAIEWAVTRGQSLQLSGGPMMPMRSTLVARATARAASWTRRDRMITPELAAEAAAASGHSAASDGREVARASEGDEVVTTTEVLWDDLQFRIDDRTRLEAAEADAAEILRMRPRPDADISRADRVHAQLSYRLALIEAASDAERAELRAELIALLRRAVDAHPTEVDFARMLIELLLTDPESAAEAATRAARLVDDARHGDEFRRLRKHALALSDQDALAQVLIAEHVARGGAARAAASDIAALVAAGLAYADAQQAWSLSAGIARRAGRAALRPVDEVKLPLSSLLDGMLALRHLGAATGPLHVLLEHEGDLAGLSSRHGPAVMKGRALLRLDPSDTSRARALGQTLATAGLSGPLELSMSARERSGRVLRLRGEVKGGELVLQAADAHSAAADWGLLREQLFAPLADLAHGHFSLPAANRTEAARMMRLASGAFGVACTRQQVSVRCSARGAFADRGRAALQALVAKRLSQQAQRLWTP